MITRVRRISLIVAFVVAAVSAWTTTADATESRITAAPQVTVNVIQTASPNVLEVYGTATCGQPTGQAELFVSGLQVLEFVYGATTTTINCAAGTVYWQVDITVYSWQWHTGSVIGQAMLTDATGTAQASEESYLWV